MSTRTAISLWVLLSFFGSSPNHSPARLTESSATSPMWRSPTLTQSASGLSRKPLQASQGMSVKYFEISSRAQSLSVSRQRRSRLVTTPSNGFFVS